MKLRELLSAINFRDFEEEKEEDTDIVRIYFDLDEWFEFGVYDFYSQSARDKLVDKVFAKKVLDSRVSSIDAQKGYLKIWLENKL